MLVKEYQGQLPHLKPGSLAAPNATAVGRVTLEPGASLWYGVVARGDSQSIAIGANTNIQDNAVLHVSATDSLSIGQGVTVGHGAILHGCTVEDDCLIGMGAILMNGCVIGSGSLVAAGALVTEGTIIPPGSLVMGSPAKVRRPLTLEERASIPASAAGYCARGRAQLDVM